MKLMSKFNLLLLSVMVTQVSISVATAADTLGVLPEDLKVEYLSPIELRLDEKTGTKLQGIYKEKNDSLALVGATKHPYNEKVLKFEVKKKGTYLYRLIMKKQTISRAYSNCIGKASELDTYTRSLGEDIMTNIELVSPKGAKDAEIRFSFPYPALRIDLKNTPPTTADCPIMSKTERMIYNRMAPPATVWRKISIKTADTMIFRYPIDHAELTLETGPKGVFPLDPSIFELIYVGDAL